LEILVLSDPIKLRNDKKKSFVEASLLLIAASLSLEIDIAKPVDQCFLYLFRAVVVED